jgi:hypothetical protein
LYESSNNTNYHSLQLNAEKRFGRGLSVLANYTWSKKFDDYGWNNPDNRRFSYGRSSEDVPHNFRFSNVWEIPRMKVPRALGVLVNGWMVNSIITRQSGFPFSITSGRDNSFTGVNRDRADSQGRRTRLGARTARSRPLLTPPSSQRDRRQLWQEHPARAEMFQHRHRSADRALTER